MDVDIEVGHIAHALRATELRANYTFPTEEEVIIDSPLHDRRRSAAARCARPAPPRCFHISSTSNREISMTMNSPLHGRQHSGPARCARPAPLRFPGCRGPHTASRTPATAPASTPARAPARRRPPPAHSSARIRIVGIRHHADWQWMLTMREHSFEPVGDMHIMEVASCITFEPSARTTTAHRSRACRRPAPPLCCRFLPPRRHCRSTF